VYEALQKVPGAHFEFTEDPKAVVADEATGALLPGLNAKSRKGQHNNRRFIGENYAIDLLNSRYCLHLRGDTTTSRRVYDSIAAGCVPLIVSDATHLPFAHALDWGAFAVFVSEATFFQKREKVFLELLEQPGLLEKKQEALAQARADLLYGWGSPANASADGGSGGSRVVDHVLAEAWDLAGVDGRYRRYPDTFVGCGERKHKR